MRRRIALGAAAGAAILGAALLASPLGDDEPSTTTTTEVPTAWGTKTVFMPSGRKFYYTYPTCGPDPCVEPRQLIIYTHGIGAPEDILSASKALGNLRNRDADAVLAFSVSKGGTKKFDAGVDYCCTWVDTQEVAYLTDMVAHVNARTPIDLERVGLFGLSNGGMLSERGICERPAAFAAAASWAGTWRTENCTAGPVTIRQWHGDQDTVAPLNGGVVTIAGHPVDVPPASRLGELVGPDSTFTLTVVPGEDHTIPNPVVDEMMAWLNEQMP